MWYSQRLEVPYSEFASNMATNLNGVGAAMFYRDKYRSSSAFLWEGNLGSGNMGPRCPDVQYWGQCIKRIPQRYHLPTPTSRPNDESPAVQTAYPTAIPSTNANLPSQRRRIHCNSMTTLTFAFPHKALTPIAGKPTAAAIKTLTREIYANAKSVASRRGGGTNGHLALVMSEDAYLLRAGQAFDVPPMPGDPPMPPAGATNAQISAADRAYDQAVIAFDTYEAVQNALRQQLLDAVEPTFYETLRDDEFGYADVTPLAILAHLTTNYGTIKQQDLEDNRDKLKAAWNPDDDITTVWTRIRNCIQFATGTTAPISEETAMLLTLESFTQSGVLAPYINEWNRKPTADQTYTNFREHFTKANDQRLREVTTKQAGFHSANSTICHPTGSTSTASTLTAYSAVTIDTGGTMYYCWTHGLSTRSDHTSATCKKPRDGHDITATAFNRKGGCNRINTSRYNKET
ncbi:hypothetical protein IV203_020893 [Nitzschia inconspicua]|uniref:Uncharacterized protein n=1 Tax=Nitzschia inconspicua TaxID=303405 RepID=A0A9K3KHA5_9STRA|nr:hypothetical protein IV203_020893 [Nitzschia inconspicua]